MANKNTDVAQLIPYSEQIDKTRVPTANDFLIERHVPTLFNAPCHHQTEPDL